MIKQDISFFSNKLNQKENTAAVIIFNKNIGFNYDVNWQPNYLISEEMYNFLKKNQIILHILNSRISYLNLLGRSFFPQYILRISQNIYFKD